MTTGHGAATDVPPGYRRTEIGVIPEDWRVERLGDFCETYSGGTPSTSYSEYYGGQIPWITSSDLNAGRIRDVPGRITKLGLVHSAAKMIKPGAVLIALYGATAGVAAITEIAAAINQAVLAIVPKSANNEYLFQYLLYKKRDIVETYTQGGQPNLSGEILRSLLIATPQPDEQRAIAEVLSDVDELIEALDKLIAKKRAIKQAAMQQLLTGKTRLPGFSGKWETKRLGEIGETFGGLSGKTKADFGHGAARYIPFMNVIYNTVIDPTDLESVDIRPGESQNQVQKGDLFFNGSSETPEEVGMCAVLLEELSNTFLNSFCFGFRLRNYNDALGLYLAYYVRSIEGRKLLYSLAQGATRYNLSKANFLQLQMPLPTIAEQRAIATVLSDMDAAIEALEKRRDKIEQIKQGMMQVLLTGRVRLTGTETYQTGDS